MKLRLLPVAALAAAAFALAACGEDEAPSDLAYGDVRAGFTGDAAAFRAAFEPFRGKRVAWQGHVAEAYQVVGDDYIRSGMLLVDMDGAAAAPRIGDVALEIGQDDIASFAPGRPVAFTMVLREFEVDRGNLVLKGELKAIE